MISMIAAIGKNNELGADNDLLWKLKDDMKLFMRTTTNRVVIMGRKSYESLGGALKNRTNVVVTRNQDFDPGDAEVFHDLDEAIDAYDSEREEIFIIGGGEIYKQALPRADRLYISHVNGEFPKADVYFPEFDPDKYRVIEEFHHKADDRNEYSFTFRLYERM